MQRFIGTKAVLARPLTRGEYNAYRDWTPPEGEDQSVEGYLVEYTDGGKPNDPRHAGYISWSPKEQFDNAYMSCEGMTFGLALDTLKKGACVQRAGWNGKGQHVYVEDMLSYTVPGGVFKGQRREYAPVLVLFNAQGIHQPGWLPSQGDLFASDWQIVTPK